MNYMYSGGCTNIVDGREIRMNKGDIVIMKPGSVHRIIWTGENDILINIILLPYASSTILNKTLIGESDLSAFLVDAVYSRTMVPNHLLLRLGGAPHIASIANLLLCEYFDPGQIAAETMVGNYLQGLFALIWRECELHPQIAEYAKKPNSRLAEIIAYTKENCVTSTRDSVAAHFGYSRSRISNIIAEGFGKGFIQLRNEFRLELAESYLASSSMSVRVVAEECGFSNMTQFYKAYKDYFGRLPRELISSV
jgi:AraC-like DNA-binding protein